MYHTLVRTRSVAFTGALALACLFGPAVVAEDDPFAPVAQEMRRFVDAGQISGAVTLVGREGHIVHLAAVGTANLEHKTPMKVDSLFRIMSMTKPVTATAIMLLAEEGKLSIDDPVQKYIPAFAKAKLESGELVRGLTIRHLLTHTSGLVGEQKCENSLEATADMLAHRPFGFQPGEKWEYGPSMNVCGRIIEVVSGQPYAEFIGERILRPLRMNDSTFYPNADQWPRVAVVYDLDKQTGGLVPAKELKIDGSPDSVASPSGGLFSTASDMFRFYQMILDGGVWERQRVISADAVQQMTSNQTGELVTGFTPGNCWGLGWCVIQRPQGVTGMLSPGTFGHGGFYGTQGWVDPQRRMIFVLMFQRDGLANGDASDMRRDFQRVAVDCAEGSR